MTFLSLRFFVSFYLVSFCCNHAVFQNRKNNFICYNKRVLKGVLQQTMRDALTERVLDFYDYSLKIFENSPVHPHNCCLIMCKRTLIKNWKEALLVRIKQCLLNLNVIFAVFKQHVVSTVTILLQLSPRIFFFLKNTSNIRGCSFSVKDSSLTLYFSIDDILVLKKTQRSSLKYKTFWAWYRLFRSNS